MKNDSVKIKKLTGEDQVLRRNPAPPPTKHPSPLLAPSYKETPRVDYPPYASTAPEAAQLFQRPSVQVHALIHYQSTPSWFIDRRILEERLFFILRGTADFVIGESEYSVGVGDCIHLRRGVRHSARTNPHDPVEFISLRYTARLFDSLLLGDVFPFPDRITISQEPPFLPMLEDGCRQFVLRPPGWQHSLDALVVTLLLWLLREFSPTPISHWQSGRVSDLQRIVPALRVMQSNLKQPLSAQAMSRACGLSEEQFRRIFARALNTSPAAYYRRIRLEKACDLLHHTNDTVENIAEQVGYQRLTSFLHAFKHLMGVPPGQYRIASKE